MKTALTREYQRPLRTETHDLDAANDVLDKLRQGEVTGRAVLIP